MDGQALVPGTTGAVTRQTDPIHTTKSQREFINLHASQTQARGDILEQLEHVVTTRNVLDVDMTALNPFWEIARKKAARLLSPFLASVVPRKSQRKVSWFDLGLQTFSPYEVAVKDLQSIQLTYVHLYTCILYIFKFKFLQFFFLQLTKE